MELKEDKNRIRLVVGWIVDIAVVISIAWFAVFAMGTQIRVSGQSMEPVLSQNEKVLMNRLSYRVMRPKRYDIIVFEKEMGNYNIKRVIGLPGETVQIKDGYIYINNEKLDAPNDLDKAALAGLAEYPIVWIKTNIFCWVTTAPAVRTAGFPMWEMCSSGRSKERSGCGSSRLAGLG